MGSPSSARVLFGYLGDGDEVHDEIVVRSTGPVPDVLWRARLGDVECCLFGGADVDVSPHRWEPASDGIVIGYVSSGAVRVTQDRRTVDVPAGRIVLYDGVTPYRLRSDGEHRFLVAHVRARAARLRREDRDALVARDLSVYPAARALAGMLGALADVARESNAAAAVHLGDAVVACLRATADEVRGVGGVRSTELFVELTAWLDARLADPALSAETLAAATFLSPRYVRKVFAENGTTVSAYLRTLRLERIRDELLQPWSVHLPVSAVAARWGYTDPSVFTRAFTRQFGQGPSRFRRSSLGE